MPAVREVCNNKSLEAMKLSRIVRKQLSTSESSPSSLEGSDSTVNVGAIISKKSARKKKGGVPFFHCNVNISTESISTQ
ncbi:hypothetical protein PNOK_0208300 [Pyrrhoderma noxium]|uniref:Uncharacterized protein n=1 Tax=Pyrrhoderma noxium TaxID=2282107 RepID=A0A286UR98_9AGAM|nr:hypothetical protein PNOK_0208300 [Pyrrhoderma noxium]